MPTEPVVEKKKGTFESVKANMQLAQLFGLLASILMMVLKTDSDLDGFLFTFFLIFVGFWQGIQSQAESIYALNSTNTELAEEQIRYRSTWEMIGAILASSISFMLVMYAQPASID